MTNEIIFQNALHFLSLIQQILDNKELMKLNDEDIQVLTECLTFKTSFEEQNVKVSIAQRLCPSDNEDIHIWSEKKIYDILKHRIPLHRLFGTRIHQQKCYQYQIFFIDNDTDQSRSEILSFDQEQTSQHVLQVFKDQYDTIYYPRGLLECTQYCAFISILYEYNGHLIQERKVIE